MQLFRNKLIFLLSNALLWRPRGFFLGLLFSFTILGLLLGLVNHVKKWVGAGLALFLGNLLSWLPLIVNFFDFYHFNGYIFVFALNT